MIRHLENAVLALAEAITRRRNQEFLDKSEVVAQRVRTGHPAFSPSELVYAARVRCGKCHAGMAYPKDSGMHGAWVCSAVLLSGDRGIKCSVAHDRARPFSMYEITSENQPSARGATTRPSDGA